jgi:zinc protease
LGTAESVEKISLKDLKDYYNSNLTPRRAAFMAVGDLDKDKAVNALKGLSAGWPGKNVKMPEIPTPQAPQNAQIYFYDVPGAKQSIVRIGSPALAATSEEFYPAEVMNYSLRWRWFCIKLTQELREGKGYTYGIRSGFEGGKNVGPFAVTSGVRTNITYDALALIKEIMENYPEGFGPEDLEVTKSFMIKSNARKFETLNAKLGILSDIHNYDLEKDFIKQAGAVCK